MIGVLGFALNLMKVDAKEALLSMVTNREGVVPGNQGTEKTEVLDKVDCRLRSDVFE
jgi:hypothetical protein